MFLLSDPYKVRNLASAMSFTVDNDDCIATVKLSWEQPCITAPEFSITVNVTISKQSTIESSIQNFLICGRTYEICVEAKHENVSDEKISSECITVTTLSGKKEI